MKIPIPLALDRIRRIRQELISHGCYPSTDGIAWLQRATWPIGLSLIIWSTWILIFGLGWLSTCIFLQRLRLSLKLLLPGVNFEFEKVALWRMRNFAFESDAGCSTVLALLWNALDLDLHFLSLRMTRFIISALLLQACLVEIPLRHIRILDRGSGLDLWIRFHRSPLSLLLRTPLLPKFGGLIALSWRYWRFPWRKSSQLFLRDRLDDSFLIRDFIRCL